MYLFKLVVVVLFQLCVVLLFVHSSLTTDATASITPSSTDHNDENEMKYIYKDQFKDIRRQIEEDIKSYSKNYGVKGFSSDPHHRRTKESINPKLGETLTALVEIHNANGPLTRIDSLFSYDSVRMVGNDTALVDVVGNDDVIRDNGGDDSNNYMKTALSKDGYTAINCDKNMCSLYVQIDQLVRLASLNYIHFVRPAVPNTKIGSVTSEGDIAMLSNQVRSTYNVNGSGLLIGVMSDSYNCLNGASQDIGTNDLPSSSNIVIVSDFKRTECIDAGTDEGRAMMQLIYDVAPGARLAFRTAFRGQVGKYWL
jgi:hypothetical protein